MKKVIVLSVICTLLIFAMGLFACGSKSGSNDSANPCNVPFCRQVDNYTSGFGQAGIDVITVSCIQGPAGATVSSQTNGQYVISGTYKLGTFNNAKISLHWGGSTSYSLYEDYSINQSGTGTFTVKVNKTSGGLGNLYLSMSSGASWMFDTVPVNTSCSNASPLIIEKSMNVARWISESTPWNTGKHPDGTIWHETPWSYFEK